MASLFIYGICQSACHAAAVACYSAAGGVFGATTGGTAIPPALIACNTSLGSCMIVCGGKFLGEASAETTVTGCIAGPLLAIGGVAVTAISGGIFWYKLRSRRAVWFWRNNSTCLFPEPSWSVEKMYYSSCNYEKMEFLGWCS